MILVISHQRDGEAAVVLHELARLRAEAQLLDLADFPRSLEIGLTFEGAETRRFLLRRRAGPDIDLTQCRAAWWRRPQPFVLHPELTRHEYQNFAYSESHEAFAGLWQAIEPFWVNHPTRDEVAHRKALQLRVAQEVGLAIPHTLISNDVAAIRQFVAQYGAERSVYKSFSATERHWRETRTLKPQEVDLLENVRYAPVIFQEYIPTRYDLRITVVGKETLSRRHPLAGNLLHGGLPDGLRRLRRRSRAPAGRGGGRSAGADEQAGSGVRGDRYATDAGWALRFP